MKEYYRADLVQAAELGVVNREYGRAAVKAFQVEASASLFEPDFEAILVARNLRSNLLKLIEIEFDEYARRRGIHVTPATKEVLMKEHSPHYARIDALMSKLKSIDDWENGV